MLSTRRPVANKNPASDLPLFLIACRTHPSFSDRSFIIFDSKVTVCGNLSSKDCISSNANFFCFVEVINWLASANPDPGVPRIPLPGNGRSGLWGNFLLLSGSKSSGSVEATYTSFSLTSKWSSFLVAASTISGLSCRIDSSSSLSDWYCGEGFGFSLLKKIRDYTPVS